MIGLLAQDPGGMIDLNVYFSNVRGLFQDIKVALWVLCGIGITGVCLQLVILSRLPKGGGKR